MRNILLLVELILCFCITGYSQTMNVTINDGNRKTLYDVYYNKILILSSDLPCDSLRVEGANVDIKKEGCAFYIKTDKNVEDVSILIFKNGQAKPLKTLHLKVLDIIPMPDLRINGSLHRELGIVLSEKTDSVFCEPYFKDKFNRNVLFSIVSFDVKVSIKGETVFSEHNENCILSPKVRSSLLRFKPNDELIISNAIAEDERSKRHYLPKKVFKIAQ